jgi:uncharacterized protein (DUF302 family)
VTRPAYAFAVDLPVPLAIAVDRLHEALAAERMGIVSEVDVQATLKAKLGLDVPPQRLLGVCSPAVAHALVEAEPDVAALLPCGCGVSEPSPGRARIVLQDPRTIAAVSTNAAVRDACEFARAALLRVVDRLEGRTASSRA